MTAIFRSRHVLLTNVVVELDWEDPLDSTDPLDWVWGHLRAFVSGEMVDLAGSGLEAILNAGHERDGDGAFGFRDEMIRQLRAAHEARLEAVAEELWQEARC